jgi:hypothetical protein
LIYQSNLVNFTINYIFREEVHFSILSVMHKGEQQIKWNAEGFPAGIYYYRIHTGTQVGSGKMILMNIHNND